MERMVVDRLIWWMEQRKLLHAMQNGLRRGRPCTENLVKIVADIKNTMRNDYTLAAFLNVSAAYDNVDLSILQIKLKKANCPIKLRKFLVKWAQTRDMQFIINNKVSINRLVNKGLPQGAVLSPILYAFYTNEIMNNLGPEISIVQFADDIAVYISNTSNK